MLRCRTNRDENGKTVVVSLRWFQPTATNLKYLREMQAQVPNQTIDIIVEGSITPAFIPIHKLNFDHKSIRELNPSII